MIQNREYTIDDYVAMARRRAKVVLIPLLLAPLAGYVVSYGFPARYSSQSLVLIEGQKVPENMVQPIVSDDLTQRVATLRQEVTSQSHLQPVVERIYPGKSAGEVGAIIDRIRQDMAVEPVVSEVTQIGAKRRPGQSGTVPGFRVKVSAPSPREAQQICNELTQLMVEENSKSIQAAANATTVVLSKGIDDAKNSLDDLDAKLAAFKKKYVGQLPGDAENNMKILAALNSQLDANTQTLNRAQADKAYTESLLAQQLATWKTSQSTTNPETLEKKLSDLQSQLLEEQAKYTDDHPDVIKTKADIAEVKRKLAEINRASTDAGDSSGEKSSASEPPEIRQLRQQVHQYTEMISGATREQKRYQDEIATYQGRVSLSPAVEQEYKQLTRDYDNAQKNYQDLLAKKSVADLTVKMNQQSEGEQMIPQDPANLPETPSFPNRFAFAGGGVGAALAISLALALWLELRDQAIRTEADAEAAMELPLLVAVPWVGANSEGSGGKFWFGSNGSSNKEQVKV